MLGTRFKGGYPLLGQTLSGVLFPHKQGEKICIKVKIKICARVVPENLGLKMPK
jgi:hypothetical protein